MLGKEKHVLEALIRGPVNRRAFCMVREGLVAERSQSEFWYWERFGGKVVRNRRALAQQRQRFGQPVQNQCGS